MCKESVVAKNVIDAVTGAGYGIGISSHNLAAFHPEGKSLAECVACVKNGTMITLDNIPPKLGQRLGIGTSAIVTFIDNSDNRQDAVQLESGQVVLLPEFANQGITMRVAAKIDVGQLGKSQDRPVAANEPREAVAA
jgi:hypothetical protein